MHVPEQPDHRDSRAPGSSEDIGLTRAEASSRDVASQFDQAPRRTAADLSSAATHEAVGLRALLTKEGVPTQRVAENKDALRRADRLLDRLLHDALERAGMLEAYSELTEAARRLAARTETLGRRSVN